jgi:hypothetical protein
MMEVKTKLSYVAPAVAVCRVELEGVVAETVYSIGFSGEVNNIGNWTEIELGEASNPGQKQGGDVYTGSW